MKGAVLSEFIQGRDGISPSHTGAPHEVMGAAFILEYVFAFLHPRALCVAARVNRTWNAVAYSQRALWRDWNVEECFKSAHPRDVLAPRFGRLRRMVVPASFVNSRGTPTHCTVCYKPLPALLDQQDVCRCDASFAPVSENISEYFQNNFSELQHLCLCIPPTRYIDPSSLTLFTSLTSLSIEILNSTCTTVYGALVTQSPHLRALTYLTRPFEPVNNFPFSFCDLMLESLEVNQIDFDDIVHMASSLKSLKITGYLPIDKIAGQICIRSIENIMQFTELKSLDISGLDPKEVSDRSWVATHVCLLSNLHLDVGQIFDLEDFKLMTQDMLSLRALRISEHWRFYSIHLQALAASHLSSTLTSLYLYNCVEALSDPECLTSFVALRMLHIELDPPHGRPPRKLVQTVMRMTELVDLTLVGLSINPVLIYPKLTRLQRLVLNYTPTSDADILIMSKKLPELHHLGLLGCYHVTLNGLLTLLAVVHLRVLEWSEPAHTRRLVAACSELCVVGPAPKESLKPLGP